MMTLELFLLIHPYKKLKIIFQVDLVKEELMKTTKITFNVKDLNLWYGNFHALKNLDMLIPQKEVTAIIGPSGCGKSTFVKTDRKSTRLNSSHVAISYAVFCLKKKI